MSASTISMFMFMVLISLTTLFSHPIFWSGILYAVPIPRPCTSNPVSCMSCPLSSPYPMPPSCFIFQSRILFPYRLLLSHSLIPFPYSIPVVCSCVPFMCSVLISFYRSRIPHLIPFRISFPYPVPVSRSRIAFPYSESRSPLPCSCIFFSIMYPVSISFPCPSVPPLIDACISSLYPLPSSHLYFSVLCPLSVPYSCIRSQYLLSVPLSTPFLCPSLMFPSTILFLYPLVLSYSQFPHPAPSCR